MHPVLEHEAFFCDMDGVIYHGNRLLPGVDRFVAYLKASRKPYLFLTNSSERSPLELSQKLTRLGLEVEASHFYTSALAVAAFLSSQKPGAGVYVIGEAGLVGALYEAGLSMNDVNPDYVVVGESRNYTIEKIEKAIQLVLKGARLIGANPDLTGPAEHGLVPACGALVAPIELATGRKAYFLGKPNPLMMRQALRHSGVRREGTIIIGDRMDTDIIAGIESGIETCLVLSGVTQAADVARYPFQPKHTARGVDELVEGLA